jgi:hypothetical protein
LFSDSDPDNFVIFGPPQAALTILGDNGNVGIGTPTPRGNLHVRTVRGGPELIVEEASPGGASQIGLKNTFRTWHLFSDASPDFFALFADPGPGHHALTIRGSNGYVGIGFTYPNMPTQKLHVLGNALADAHLTPSSRRWKQNITPIEGALDKVLRLQGVSFDWTTDGRHDLGLIAEEVGEVLPELVTYDGADASSLDYARLVAVLIEAVKEQQERIEALEARIR